MSQSTFEHKPAVERGRAGGLPVLMDPQNNFAEAVYLLEAYSSPRFVSWDGQAICRF
jgi:hypothetical protein